MCHPQEPRDAGTGNRAARHAGTMSRLRPLPEELHRSPFTHGQARKIGVPSRRLSAADLERFAYGLYRRRADSWQPWSELGLPDPGHELDPPSLTALLGATGGVLSHQSAAHLYGIPLPPWLEDETNVQITGPGEALRSRRLGVTGHRRPLGPADVVPYHGLSWTTPERTWLDLASLMKPGQEELLVAAGDHLVKHPWVDGRREKPWTTTVRLEQVFRRTGRFKGVRLARAALPLIRVGADSPTETLVRLCLVEAGLPEPELQVYATALATDPYPADLGYREARIALQYDGEHHRTPEQQLIDVRRDAWFLQRGWLVIRITVEDLRDDLRTVVQQIRHQLSSLAA